jgi:CDP-diacylglycerol--serine O-phosphatidyltransferase
MCLILDYLDGYIARKLNTKSDVGIQLDSLADMVSFGLVPGILLYNMFNEAPSSSVGSISSSFYPFFGFIITLSSAYRLARYNSRKSTSKFFKGLPTPANAVLIYTFAMISAEGNSFSNIILNYNVLMLIVIVSSILLVSNLKLLNFKFKSLKLEGNRRRFFIILISIPALIIFGIYAIPFILSVYILISIFTFYKFKD